MTKIRLLLENGAKSSNCWMCDTPDVIKLKYSFSSKTMYQMDPNICVPDRSNSLSIVTDCRLFLKSAETDKIVQKVTECVKLITTFVSKLLNLKFESSLSGSFAETTKCFGPDEFDFTLGCLHKLEENEDGIPKDQDLALKVYACIDSIIRNAKNGFDFGNLTIESLLYGNKISSIHMLWNGKEMKRLDITVDLAVCYKNIIFKGTRYYMVNRRIRITNHIKEQQMIRKLPLYIRNGLILAKAVRIANIAHPENIERFELQETIKTDDVISSFILKACLFGKDKHKEVFNECLTPHDVATTIYELLQKYLLEKKIESEYSQEKPLECSKCQVERGCCKRRKIMLAIVEKILQWLYANKSMLQNIEFSYERDFSQQYRALALIVLLHRSLSDNDFKTLINKLDKEKFGTLVESLNKW